MADCITIPYIARDTTLVSRRRKGGEGKAAPSIFIVIFELFDRLGSKRGHLGATWGHTRIILASFGRCFGIVSTTFWGRDGPVTLNYVANMSSFPPHGRHQQLLCVCVGGGGVNGGPNWAEMFKW